MDEVNGVSTGETSADPLVALLLRLENNDGPGAPTAEPWMDRAACAGTDPEAFFPEKGGSTRKAKSVCGGCSVRDECLAYALRADERFGIWGGLSEKERRKLRRGTYEVGVGEPAAERPRRTLKWSPAADQRLRELANEHTPNSTIARELGISPQSVSIRRQELGLPKLVRGSNGAQVKVAEQAPRSRGAA